MGSVIRYLAVAMSVVVALGFVLFAIDELDKGSKAQQRAVGQEAGESDPTVGAVSPTPAEELARERAHSSPREAIDDANDILLAPFSGLADFPDSWAARGVPTLLALLLYGGGLGLLANFLPKPRHGGGDWRTA